MLALLDFWMRTLYNHNVKKKCNKHIHIINHSEKFHKKYQILNFCKDTFSN